MKKITFLLIGFLSISLTLMAQETPLRLGVQVSPTFSWMTTNDNSITGNGTNTGLNLGLVGEYYFQDNYAITSGISLTMGQGGTLEYGVGGNFFPDSELSDSSFTNLPNGVNVRYGLQYIEIPLSIKLQTNEIGYLRYFAQIPYFSVGFPIQGRADFSNGVTSENENVLPSLSKMSLTWGLGAGVEYALSENASFVGGLYFDSSILDIVEDADSQLNTGGEEDSKQVINRLTIRLSVLF